MIGPELGITLPGTTIVCGDSHTSTHGAFGAFALGIGTSDVEHVLATQCLVLDKPKTFEIRVDGKRKNNHSITAKDIILSIIKKIGTAGGNGTVLEYRGQAISDLSMDERKTICNMSIEGGARAGLVAPDQKTFDYLKNKRYTPKNYDELVDEWKKTLKTDDGAKFDRSFSNGSAGTKGLVVAPLREALDAREGEVHLYACGPTPVLRAVAALALERGVPCDLSLEAPMACGFGVCLGCVVPCRGEEPGSVRYERVCVEGPVMRAERLAW